MPISLPPVPLSRRQFLKRSIAAATGLLLTRDLFAAGKATDKHSWALLADTHIAADKKLMARGINMTDNFIVAAKDVVALAKRPAGLLINGDLAYSSGQTGDYGNFAEMLAPIREAQIPTHLTLGNHDHREHFWAALHETKTTKRPVADKYVGTLKTSRANFFLLDSLDKTSVVSGLLDEEQLDWLKKSLDANKSKPALIFAHHNLQADSAKVSGIRDTEKLLEILAPRRQVKAFIFGHTHNWHIKRHESGIHLINLPPVAYVFAEGKPAGWVHAQLERSSMRLELRCLDAKHPQQGETHELKWRT